MAQKPLTARDVMQDLADKFVSTMATLEATASIVELHPEWQEQEPQLKPLLDVVKGQEDL
jgi:hypothetical protein